MNTQALDPLPDIVIPESEYTITATRSAGPGGQHVNKVSTAIILHFDILQSSLSEQIQRRLLESKDNRITEEGVLVIKASTSRSQLRNKEAAINKLHDIVRAAAKEKKKRKPTKPSKTSVEKRLEEKTLRSEIKEHRKKPKL